MEARSKRDEIIELINKLFIYTDYQQWDKLLKDVFTDEVLFDMSSAGAGDPRRMPAAEICAMWEAGFKDIDAVHHQSGNFLVSFRDESNADVFCYAVASHFKNTAVHGKTREFVGGYDLHAVLTDQGWRLSGFRYLLKYINGNADLK
jgi:hypothetical protein